METISNKRIAKNTAFMYVRMFFVMVASLISSRVILDALGATDYGTYDVAGGIVTMMSFLNGALSASTNRFLAYELGRGNHSNLCGTFSALLNLHIGVAVLAVLTGETIGLWFLYHKLVIPEERMIAAFWVFQFSIISVVFNFTQIPYSAALIAHEKLSVYAYVGLYEAVSKLGIGLLIKYAPMDRLIFYALLLSVNKICIQFFYRFYTARRFAECRFHWIRDRALYKTLIGYSGWDLFGCAATVCQGQGVSIVLNMFLGPTVNAARSIAMQAESAVNQFVVNLTMAARPNVIKSFAREDYGTMYNLTFNIARYAWMMILAIILPLCFEIEFVLNLWLVEVPDHTLNFAVIVLVGALLNTVNQAQLMAFHAIGKIKTGNVEGGITMMMALPTSYLILRFGGKVEWCLATIVLFNLITQFNGLRLIHGYVPFRLMDLFRTVYVPIAVVSMCAVVVPLMIHLMMPAGMLRFICNLLSTETSLCAIVWFFGITPRERTMVGIFFKQKIWARLQH